jgi:hypothetical protein
LNQQWENVEMKTIPITLTLFSLLILAGACGQRSANDSDRMLLVVSNTPRQNPTGDPVIQKAYDDHQRAERERREQQREEQRREGNGEFTVHTTGEGHGGVPTSGGYPPPNGMESH